MRLTIRLLGSRKVNEESIRKMLPKKILSQGQSIPGDLLDSYNNKNIDNNTEKLQIGKKKTIK